MRQSDKNIQPNIKIYTEPQRGATWLARHGGVKPVLICVLGFTATARIEGISAAGKTPQDREFTAAADAEFLHYGINHQPKYPLPPLIAGASPVFITRAVTENLQIPTYIFNAGLSIDNPFPEIVNLQGCPARCLTTGQAMDLEVVEKLFVQGYEWGKKFSQSPSSANQYLIISECVVAGTTTALAVLMGLGINAIGKVNSSHPICNHEQKLQVVQTALNQISHLNNIHPYQLIAAIGDPMQIVVAGMAIAASHNSGVMLAGGTQMLAVYALARAIAFWENLSWYPENIVVGTTRWVAEDPTGATVELAEMIGQSSLDTPPLLATQLNFTNSRFPQLQAYEHGFVKEGVGAGGSAIASHLYASWQNLQLVDAVENLIAQYISSNFRF